MTRLKRRGAGPLCRAIVDSDRLAGFCDRLESIPDHLLALVRTGLYRPAPRFLPIEPGAVSFRAAFADLLATELPLVLVPLRCTQRVRLVLEEFAVEAGPFLDVLSVTMNWLDPDRFAQGTQGEFWSLARCLTLAGVQPNHWEAGWKRPQQAPG
jgi:hypothetical protein